MASPTCSAGSVTPERVTALLLLEPVFGRMMPVVGNEPRETLCPGVLQRMEGGIANWDMFSFSFFEWKVTFDAVPVGCHTFFARIPLFFGDEKFP